jgi:hypothetical protein
LRADRRRRASARTHALQPFTPRRAHLELNGLAARAARTEDAMNTAEHTFEPQGDAGRHAGLLAGSRCASEVVTVVRNYLAAWPKARVADLQRIDGGWAPFDASLQPTPLYRPADLQRICVAVHEQCASLQGAGVTPVPELIELDVFLSLACTKLAEIEPTLAPQRPTVADRQPESRTLR